MSAETIIAGEHNSVHFDRRNTHLHAQVIISFRCQCFHYWIFCTILNVLSLPYRILLKEETVPNLDFWSWDHRLHQQWKKNAQRHVYPGMFTRKQ